MLNSLNTIKSIINCRLY